jgi:hypothetical protein
VHFHGTSEMKFDSGFKIKYKQKGKEYETEIPIVGEINDSWNPPFAKNQVKKKENSVKATNYAPKVVDEKKFKHVINYTKGLTKFDFDLEFKNTYPKIYQKPDLINMGKLSAEDFSGEYSIRLRNKTGKQLYLLGYNKAARNCYFEHTGSLIIEPDSFAVVKLKFDSIMPGNFESELKVDFKGVNELDEYKLVISGHQSFKGGSGYHKLSSSDSLKIILHGEKKTIQNYKIEGLNGFQVGKGIYDSLNNYLIYKAPYKWYQGERWFKLSSKSSPFVFKMALREYKQEIFIMNTWEIPKIHFYLGGGPSKLDIMENTYMVTWKYDENKVEDVMNYLKKEGLNVSRACQLYITTGKDFNVQYWQKKLKNSTYKLDLCLPIFIHRVTEQGWGGGCEYLTNKFSVTFFKNTSEKRIAEIFAKCGITNFKSYANKAENPVYYFTIKYIADLKYIQLLDRLYQCDEVTAINQENAGLSDLD